MKVKDIACRYDFDPSRITSIKIQQKAHRPVILTGMDINWGNINFGIESFLEPNGILITYWDEDNVEYRQPVDNLYFLGIDKHRLYNDEKYFEELKTNW